MTGTVKFILDGRVHEVQNPDPTETLLNYLRYGLGRTGTKEGCAEGDCGACTVVVGELQGDGGVRYRAVNACILFLPTLDGKELLTVESLKGRDGGLHPVQQALVETHGSQCGFCTPGFVMSLYALYLEGPNPSRARIKDALAGNLCRCTGYGPIIEAAERMHTIAPDDLPDVAAAAKALKAIRRMDTLSLSAVSKLTGGEKKYFAPVTIGALADLAVAYPDATFLAGGTDVGLWVTKQHRELETLISLGDVPELKMTRESSESLEIGAGVSVADAMELLGNHYGDMGELFRRFASVQIRNSGTLGGNIANGSPIGDSMPALIAAGAKLVLRWGAEERTIPLEDYFITYGQQDRALGEFVVRIIVPKPAEGLKYRAYKLSKRFDQDISAVCGAFALTLEDGMVTKARIAFGGMAATPKRAEKTEAAITGKPWTRETVARGMVAMAEDYTPLSDMRASAEYRLRAARNLLMKAFVETTGTADTRLVGDKELAHA
ncbi:xanthine dehydrogenase small subunit [Kordiimonas marina]|uniref:xanthine dehydrogenase small subunit n=1 Tax=Kordiimonas marina TaxID=2872312 RepID=UPI001FF624B5|nr:xanthine dehydrogenase small subunit [Kordiimonas marina]